MMIKFYVKSNMIIRGPFTFVFQMINYESSNGNVQSQPILMYGEMHHSKVSDLNVHTLIEEMCTLKTTLFIERFRMPKKIGESASLKVSHTNCIHKIFVDVKKFNSEFNKALFSGVSSSKMPILEHRHHLANWMKNVYSGDKDKATDAIVTLFDADIPHMHTFVDTMTDKFNEHIRNGRSQDLLNRFEIVQHEFIQNVVLGPYHPQRSEVVTSSNAVDIATNGGATIFAVCILQDLYTADSILFHRTPSIFYGGSTHVWQIHWLLEHFYKFVPTLVYMNRGDTESCDVPDAIYNMMKTKFA